MEDCCAVCAEPLEWLAYGPCGHNEVCSNCTARMRFVLDDKCCCICKQECPTVFVTKALGDYTKSIKDFSALSTGVNDGKVGDYWFHSDTQAYFDDELHYKMIKAMCRLSCIICERDSVPKDPGNELHKRDREFKHIDQLRRHLYHSHKLSMCTLCLEGRKVFIGEQTLYTRAQLDRHLSKGDSEVDGNEIERGGFTGHPMCDFCRKRFYGDNELYMHMQTEHYTCHICQRRHPGHFDYYRNYNDLEAHFGQEHFLCENPECLAKKFVFFSTESELKRHNALEHAGNMSRSQRNAALQIPVSFQYRRPDNLIDAHRSSRARGGRGRGRSMNDQPSTANVASVEMFNLENAIHESLLTATADNIYGSVNSDSMPPLPSSEVTASSSTNTFPNEPRYLTALGRISVNSLEESAFPPLPGVSENVGQFSNKKGRKSGKSMAAILRGSKGNVKVLNTFEPRQHTGPALPASSPPVSSHFNRTNRSPNTNHSDRLLMPSSSGVHARQSAISNVSPIVSNPNEFPPILGRQNVTIVSGTGTENRSTITNVPPILGRQNVTIVSGTGTENQTTITNEPALSTEETKAANKTLIESIRLGLGGDEQRFASFKDFSSQFRNGNLDAQKYYAYISRLGLYHLVPELARLCPDKDKQRELLEAHHVASKGSQHAVNQITSQAMGMLLTSTDKNKQRKLKNVVAGSSADATSSSPSVSAPRFTNASDEVEVLSKDGYRTANGKSKEWETQPLDKEFGSDGLSSGERNEHLQRPPLLDNPSSLGEKWSCSACTLLNVADSMLCVVCGSERPNGITKDLRSGGKDKQKKKATKSQRGRLLDLSAANQSSQIASGGSVWGNGGGQRLLYMAQRDPFDSSYNFRR